MFSPIWLKYNYPGPVGFNPTKFTKGHMSNRYEYYSTSSSRRHGAHDRDLPPIHEVVGPELDRRTPLSPYANADFRGVLPAPSLGQSSRGEQRGPTLPPIQQGYASSGGAAYPGHSGPQVRYPSQHAGSAQPQRGSTQAEYRHHSSHQPDYAYGVLRTSGTGDFLVHAIPPAPRAQGILRQGGAPPPSYEDPDKRHKCDYCGKKFDRPSSLQVHVRTHTGSQPFTCDWPGCDRSFSVRSNMLRHWRSHERSEVSQFSPSGHETDNRIEEEDYPEAKSSLTTGQHSSANYYSSSRSR